VLGHIGLNVVDLSLSKRYYDDLMPLVGYTALLSRDDQFAYAPAPPGRGPSLFFYPAVSGQHSDEHPGLQHLAFLLRTRSAVAAVHALVVRNGDEVLHPPQYFPQYTPNYFAVFWRDPNGFKLEAACMRDEE
jgi:catechol 2,3-dioxygenase-like lactoylglutathione lyase family enzyme